MDIENKLIADFIGAVQTYKPYVNTDDMEYDMYGVIPTIEDGENEKHYFLPQEMLFDTDWNWLMVVVEKIENMEDENRCSKYNFEMVQTFVEIIDNNNSDTIVEIDKNTKIQATYKAVVEFIKWYNKQK
jgi:hypothetical protein